MMNTPVRPAEWLHERRCLARALICAVENLRDDYSRGSDLGFRVDLQDNYPLVVADEYLRDGLLDCTCSAPWPCPVCGWQYPAEDLESQRRGETTLDPNPTHLCR